MYSYLFNNNINDFLICSSEVIIILLSVSNEFKNYIITTRQGNRKHSLGLIRLKYKAFAGH